MSDNNDEYEKLKNEHMKLKDEYEVLLEKYKKLENDYSENVIIQSMQEMKERYDRLVEYSVPLSKYSSILDKYTYMCNNLIGVNVIIEHIIKCFSNYDRLYSTELKVLIKKVMVEIELIQDIICDSK